MRRVTCDALNQCTPVTPGSQVTIGSMPQWFGTPASSYDRRQRSWPSTPPRDRLLLRGLRRRAHGRGAVRLGDRQRRPADAVSRRRSSGMHVEGAEAGAWPSAPFGALRLWDNGTAWSQIELEPGRLQVGQPRGRPRERPVQGHDATSSWSSAPPPSGTPRRSAPTTTRSRAPRARPRTSKAWDAWVTEVATRYKGRITAYQIWNEANLKNFWSGTPEEMADLTKRAYDIIKEDRPRGARRVRVAVDPAHRPRSTSSSRPTSRRWPRRTGPSTSWPSTPTPRRTAIRSRAARSSRRAGVPHRGRGARPAALGHRAQLRPGRPRRPAQAGDHRSRRGRLGRAHLHRRPALRRGALVLVHLDAEAVRPPRHPGLPGLRRGAGLLRPRELGVRRRSSTAARRRTGDAVTCDFTRDGQTSGRGLGRERARRRTPRPRAPSWSAIRWPTARRPTPGAEITLTEVPIRIYTQK